MNGRGIAAKSYVLLLASLLGMNLMAVSSDLVMLYLAIETASIPLYILAGFLSMTSARPKLASSTCCSVRWLRPLCLYGFSLIFGFSGTTDLYAIASHFTFGQYFTLACVWCAGAGHRGLGLQVSIVPFHFWAPDVYQGSPTPIAGYLSTASKAAGFAVVLRLFFAALPDFAPTWTFMILRRWRRSP
jgi:NADH-quinone oxidoreductase subunit N